MEERKNISIVLLVLAIISLVATTFLAAVYFSFNTAESTTDTLKQSNTFFYLSEAVKQRVKDNYPPRIEDNFLRRQVADRLVEFVVTPDVFEKRSEGFITFFQKILERPIVAENERIFLETEQYKEQATQAVESLGLPAQIRRIATEVANAAPERIELVNKDERPNSLLAIAIEISNKLNNLKLILTVAAVILAAALLALLALNWERWIYLLSKAVYLFSISGGIVGVIYLFVRGYSGTLPDDYRGQMISSLVATLNQKAVEWGLAYLALGLAGYLVLRIWLREDKNLIFKK